MMRYCVAALLSVACAPALATRPEENVRPSVAEATPEAAEMFPSPRSASAQNLRSVAVPPRAIDMAECLSMLELRPGLLSGVCRSAGEESSELHLVIVEVTASATKRTYLGPGAGDAYYMQQTVFASSPAEPIVVIAESGAEFSYGLGLYLVEASQPVTYAGELAVGVSNGENVVSAVPFVLMDWDVSGLCLRFARDLVHAQPDGTYSVLSRDRVAFVYSSGQLREVDSCASRRERAESTLVVGPSR